MVFLKRCFSCGEKVENLHKGLCEDCYKEEHPPISEIKPLNLKVCNQCGKIHYNNSLQTLDYIREILPNIMKNRVVLNDEYKFNSLEIKNFELKGNKIMFDVEVDCDFV